ncbi:FG-GAP repeat domain-containing protein [Roseicella aquatilis]|uniref:VCBS repeat-containing protein n=1 Tax=Roseicella aquatilis TaxID=2527868 RepID=A0A4R4D9X0_9PROT|nr:VCBS repeat-containing protein [Roseicella aquatilis]TCZ55956.1 VCBS repeat-containing protein [Roseicella aquatilis]
MAQKNLYGTSGNDTLDGSIYGPADFVVAYGYGGNDLLIGSKNSDRFAPGAGNNAVYGYDGNDSLHLHVRSKVTQANFFDGGSGRDSIVFYGDPSMVTLRNYGTYWKAEAPGLDVTLTNVETVTFNNKGVLTTRTLLPVANDFDGDGKSDILWSNTGLKAYAPDGVLSQWRMDGATYRSGDTFGLHKTAYTVSHTADFNGDGMADILWAKAGGGAAIWQMDGYDAEASGDIALPGNDKGWSIADTGDFNGDGKADILFTRQASWNGQTFTKVYLQQMNGLSVTGGGEIATVGADWSIAGTGDFNNDAKADILWRNAGGEISIWTMDGTTYLGGGTVAKPGPYWDVAGTGDFNNDGRSDILFRGAGGEVSVWLMRDLKVIAGVSLYNPGPDWEVATIADYDGNGVSDILWRQAAGEGGAATEVKMWLMNGTANSTAVMRDTSLGYLDTDWQVVA